METKICKRCGICKTESDYYFIKGDVKYRTKDRHDLTCKECRKQDVRSYRVKNPEKCKINDKSKVLKNPEKYRKIKSKSAILSYHANRDKHLVKLKEYQKTESYKKAKKKYMDSEKYFRNTATGNLARDLKVTRSLIKHRAFNNTITIVALRYEANKLNKQK